MTQTVIAIMCESQLWCPDHAEYDSQDIEDGHVTLVTQFDVDCGTSQADWLKGGCCHGCGVVFAESDD